MCNRFEYCSAESKKRMALPGSQPECLLDAWIKEMLDARAYEASAASGQHASGEGKPLLVRDYSDNEIGLVLLSFLFASQDAMTSGLIYAFQFMADYPEVAEKVRKEQLEVRAGDFDAPFTLEMLDQSPYLRAFVKETLRYRRESGTKPSCLAFAPRSHPADICSPSIGVMRTAPPPSSRHHGAVRSKARFPD